MFFLKVIKTEDLDGVFKELTGKNKVRQMIFFVEDLTSE